MFLLIGGLPTVISFVPPLSRASSSVSRLIDLPRSRDSEVRPTSWTASEVRPASWTTPEVRPTSWTTSEVRPASWTISEVRPASWTTSEGSAASPNRLWREGSRTRGWEGGVRPLIDESLGTSESIEISSPLIYKKFYINKLYAKKKKKKKE